MQESTLYRGHWLVLKERGRWEYVERTNPGGAVVILAVTAAQAIVLVEQPRVTIGCRSIELPAGLVGDLEANREEDFFAAARRELEEETGYRCTRFEFLHSGPTSAGMSTEFAHFVRAHELERTGPGGGVDGEDITVHEVPLASVAPWLAERAAAGLSVDPKLMAGLWLLGHPGPYNVFGTPGKPGQGSSEELS